MADLLVQHGATVLFAWAFAVQVGAPIPAVPMLLGAGALSGSGQMNLALAIGAAMAATLGADAIWYSLGWSMGPRILGHLARFSLNPTPSSGAPRSASSPTACGPSSWRSFCPV
jgi:membrane protein DedA with SNARE-associated domain